VKALANRFVLAAFLVAAFAAVSFAGPRPRRPGQTAVPKITLQQIAQGKTFGVSNAPIRIDAYTDFECPHCQDLYLNTLRPLIDEYVSSGKVYLVDHDFPFHPYSRIAAYYADAAAAIGRFSPVAQALFLHQSEWSYTGKVEPIVAAVLSPAKMKIVQALAQTSVVHQAVQDDYNQGMHLGVNQTPTMFITHNGQKMPIVGFVSYPILRRYIDALLHQ
jgi:protein-disulfide isomerase